MPFSGRSSRQKTSRISFDPATIISRCLKWSYADVYSYPIGDDLWLFLICIGPCTKTELLLDKEALGNRKLFIMAQIMMLALVVSTKD
jgi:hypothetical protein